jgi:hypothetical protein
MSIAYDHDSDTKIKSEITVKKLKTNKISTDTKPQARTPGIEILELRVNENINNIYIKIDLCIYIFF